MRIGFTILVLFTLFLNQKDLKAQDIFSLNAVVYSTKDSTPVGFAHIINTFTNYGVVTEYNGEFNFIVAENDTLKISAIGYNTLKVAANKTTKKFYLEPKNYELEEFTVIPYKDFIEFREAFSELQVYDSTLQVSPLIFLNGHLYNYHDNEGRFGVTISGGISMIYDALSKKGKSKRRYQQLIIRDRYEKFLATKFNLKVIKQATYVKDEATLKDIKLYCDFTDYFIANANDYQIIKEIQDCYKEYVAVTN